MDFEWKFVLLFMVWAFKGKCDEAGPLPNFLLIVTDDQDITLGGMTPMEKTQKLLANEGVTFTNAFTSSPICCPSRASILSGQYAHNHRTRNNSYSGGCYSNYWRNSVEPRTLPVWFEILGYNTFFAGKYLNEYNSGAIPLGWQNWFGLKGNSKYYNFTLFENGIETHYTDQYMTDLLKSRASDFISNQTDSKPFFAMITPTAPHAPFTSAPRHQKAFQNITAPRKKNFNVPVNEFDKHWLLRMPPATLPDDVLHHLDDIYRWRWQTLLSVDEMIGDLIAQLDEQQLLNNTYIIYTSDNGYHLGQFGMAFDKRQPYETDIRVPFIIRGPGVQTKAVVDSPIALIDIFPSLLDLAGIPKLEFLDGISFVDYLSEKTRKNIFREILIEYWGEGNDNTYNQECPWSINDRLSLCLQESACHCQDAWNNTYTCQRQIGNDVDRIYCEFLDIDHFVEAYDLTVDPYQLDNLGYKMLPSERSIYSIQLEKLRSCVGVTCQKIEIL